jgi:site-specific DNA recombinase
LTQYPSGVTTTEATYAAIYARISKDDGTALGVARQIEDCTREAERRGWTIAQVYTDNDVSASTTRPRPEFQRMMREVDAGRLRAIVVWDPDRLSRSPRENEDLIDRADRHGLQLANVGGDMDLSTVHGRLTFRIKGSVARAEVEQQSRRLKRKFDERATNGLPHGKVAFGYRRLVEYDEHGRRLGSRDVIDPEQAEVIRETARRLLTGQSLRSVVKHLNDSGATSPGGKPWSSTTLRQVMLRDRNAGLRRHRGSVFGQGAWDPIYDEGTHQRVVALLTVPCRKTNKGGTIKHLLTGLARCGLCGGGMRATPAAVHNGKHMPPRYQCRDCYRVARKQSSVDDVVVRIVVNRLSEPDALMALATGQPERAAELRRLIEEAGARLELAADDFADGALSGDQLRRITAKLRPQIEAWKAEQAACAPREGLLELVGPDAAELWAAAPLDVRRAVIDMLMTVTILPSGSGQSFDRDQIRVTWRDGYPGPTGHPLG